MFTRLYTVSPKQRELFAIRALLLCRSGITSFEDLKTVGDHQHDTFVDAAIALGLLESDDLYAQAMRDACAEKSNFRQLQHYFAMLLFHCVPSNAQALFDEFLDEMMPYFPMNRALNFADKRFFATLSTTSVVWVQPAGLNLTNEYRTYKIVILSHAMRILTFYTACGGEYKCFDLLELFCLQLSFLAKLVFKACHLIMTTKHNLLRLKARHSLTTFMAKLQKN